MQSYSDIRDQIGRELADLGSADAQAFLVEHITELRFEIGRLKDQQRTLMTALRARDVIVQERSREQVHSAVSRLIELDPRDNLDIAEGLHRLEWDRDIAIRWTGPDHATVLRVWLDRTVPVVLEIALTSFGDERNRGAVTLTVDGIPLSFAEAEAGLLRSGAFPSVAGSLYSEIVIHVPFLSGQPLPDVNADEAKGVRTKAGQKRRARAPVAASDAAAEAGRGIAISHIRFFSPG